MNCWNWVRRIWQNEMLELLIESDDESDDLVIADGEVIGQDELVRQVRLVVVAVVAAANDGVAVVVEDLGHRDGHPVADQFLGHPAADGLAAPEFPVRIVDQGVVGEGGHDSVLVERVDGGDVLGQNGRQGGGVSHAGSLVRGLVCADDSTLGAPSAGGSSADPAFDPPVTGGLTMA